jgi:hypothetical protein
MVFSRVVMENANPDSDDRMRTVKTSTETSTSSTPLQIRKARKEI